MAALKLAVLMGFVAGSIIGFVMSAIAIKHDPHFEFSGSVSSISIVAGSWFLIAFAVMVPLCWLLLYLRRKKH